MTASFGIASHGQGLETTLAQVIADELGARLDDIQIVHGDSAGVAHGTGTYASRSAVLAGGAATQASRLLKEKLVRAASHLLEAAVEDIEVADGRVFVVGTDRSLTFREVAKAVYSEMGRLPPGAREELEVTKTYDPVFGTTTSATHIAALEIDPKTYKVTIHRYVVAEDCGRVINPMIVDGQVHGGVAQGIGAALYEEVVYDDDRPAADRDPRRLRHPLGGRGAVDRDHPSRHRVAVDPRRAFAAWARAARSARRRRSPTRWPTRWRRSASRFSNCR